MNKSIPACILACCLVVSPTASAMSKSDKACGAILCLTGLGGAACIPYLNPYFAITSFIKGCFFCGTKFSSSRTKSSRRKYLSNCNHVSSSVIDDANNRYGRSRNAPTHLTD